MLLVVTTAPSIIYAAYCLDGEHCQRPVPILRSGGLGIAPDEHNRLDATERSLRLDELFLASQYHADCWPDGVCSYRHATHVELNLKSAIAYEATI